MDWKKLWPFGRGGKTTKPVDESEVLKQESANWDRFSQAQRILAYDALIADENASAPQIFAALYYGAKNHGADKSTSGQKTVPDFWQELFGTGFDANKKPEVYFAEFQARHAQSKQTVKSMLSRLCLISVRKYLTDNSLSPAQFGQANETGLKALLRQNAANGILFSFEYIKGGWFSRSVQEIVQLQLPPQGAAKKFIDAALAAANPAKKPSAPKTATTAAPPPAHNPGHSNGTIPLANPTARPGPGKPPPTR